MSAGATDALPAEAAEILRFWFGDLDPLGQAGGEQARRWWVKDDAFDREIGSRFGATFADVAGGRNEHWLTSPRGRLAYVIALDQFPRNMFRGTPQAFATDNQALAAARTGVDRGDDKGLGLDERSFLYMPFMHSEDPAMQERSVALFEALVADAPAERRAQRAGALDYARRHRDIVVRFGRFPHRNEQLERTSTAEELEFLSQPNSGF